MVKRLPRSIWALGIVSLLMDVSSEMIHGLLPVFLVTVLGASTITVGLIEGVGDAATAFTKLFSGVLSDALGKRKALVALGYGMATLSKPFFAMAPSPGWVLGARFADRVGKGLRGSPRDALVADLVEPEQHGAAYGLRQALDNVGAFVGPLLAIALMAAFAGQFRLVFWLSVIPGAAAVAVLLLFVREPPRRADGKEHRPRIDRRALGRLGGLFWGVVAVGAVLTLARFSEAFVILAAEGRGLAAMLAPLVLVAIHVVSSASAYPAGLVGDRIDKRIVLAVGFGALIAADLVLALSSSMAALWAGVALWGLHLGLTQGLLSALVADTAPEELRGTAFGVFHMATGFALLAASVLAGALWAMLGPQATFFGGALFAGLGLLGYVLFGPGAQGGGDEKPQP